MLMPCADGLDALPARAAAHRRARQGDSAPVRRRCAPRGRRGAGGGPISAMPAAPRPVRERRAPAQPPVTRSPRGQGRRTRLDHPMSGDGHSPSARQRRTCWRCRRVLTNSERVVDSVGGHIVRLLVQPPRDPPSERFFWSCVPPVSPARRWMRLIDHVEAQILVERGERLVSKITGFGERGRARSLPGRRTAVSDSGGGIGQT